MISGSSPWVMRVHRPEAKLRLFCFPYAGAGASAYRGWSQHLPEEVEVCALQPPGRESRFREAPAASLMSLVFQLVEHTRTLRDRPYALFGHSLGAMVAFELTRALRSRGEMLPLQLFVSASAAPQTRDHDEPMTHLTDEQLLAKLRAYEGTPAALLDDPQMRDVLLPTLRADLALRDGYHYAQQAPLPLPVTALGGKADPHVQVSDLTAWREQTSAGFALRSYEGGHFYIHSARTRFLRELALDLRDLARLGTHSERLSTGDGYGLSGV